MDQASEPDMLIAAEAAISERRRPGRLLVEEAEKASRACRDMAERFHAGGKLIVFGNSGATTDAQHIAVEFVHPVIVGKRALPAISLTNDVATITGVATQQGAEEIFAHQVRLLAEPQDIALGVSAGGDDRNVLRAFEEARDAGLLTIGLLGGDGGEAARSTAVDHALIARSSDPRIVKEIHVTMYHVLWELVHVFFEQPGALAPEVVS